MIHVNSIKQGSTKHGIFVVSTAEKNKI